MHNINSALIVKQMYKDFVRRIGLQRWSSWTTGDHDGRQALVRANMPTVFGRRGYMAMQAR